MKKLHAEINELITFRNSQGLTARGTLLKLSQNYIVFEVYNPYSIVQLSEVLSDVKILRAGKEIYDGRATVTNIVNTGIVLIVSATIPDSCWKDLIDVNSKSGIEKEIQYLISDFDLQSKVDVNFKLNVLEIGTFLSDLKNWFDRLEPSFDNSKIKFDNEFMFEYFEPLLKKMGDLCNQFGEISSKIQGDRVLYQKFSQSHLHPFLMSSPFPYRIYTKPLGFAGDYMMMHMIHRENLEGPNLYAKFINTFYINIPVSVSARNRTDKLLETIEEGVKQAELEGREYHSLSIGCGPALEVKRFIEKNNPKVKCNFKLLDFNEETLNFAKSEAEKVKGNKMCEITTQLDSVHALLKKSVNKEVQNERYDFVYCSGLFDYLSDKICSRLTKMFYTMLKERGKVLVTNMHSDNTYHPMMDLVFEWYLIHRDEKVMETFAPNLGNQKLFTDPTGINLCLEITK
jgi:extracellular factor (EF) 3-hydroxypalmitic acid methyl ester biosynthesis protein